MDSGSNVPSQQGQKEAFLNGLSQFLADKGKYLCKAPKLAGKTIDLHDLYNTVTSAGGYQKVTDKGFWEDFLEAYGFKVFPVTLAYGLQKVYQSYLEDYEKVHFFGDDETNPLNRNFGGYRRFRYTISDSQRIANNMNMIKPSVSNYDRVVLSLESCLPNEIDFAVNACTLLSGESRHVLRLPQCPRIVDALLLHAGIVSEGCNSYKSVLSELQERTGHDFNKFWQTSVLKKSVLPTLLPCKYGTTEGIDKSVNLPDDSNFKEALEKRLNTILLCDPKGTDSYMTNTSPSKWPNLFHGHRSLGVQDYEGQRVLQIALVLLNLSFEDFNVVLLARHSSLLRFVFLCIHSQYSCLRQTGLDILSNISSHIELHRLHYDVASMVFDTVHTTLTSDDKFERIRGCEILGNICRCKGNGEQVSISVQEDVYEAAVRNLLISDVELLLSALEALYRLSKLGETTCTKIIFIHGSVDTLICLVTLNVRTFGPEKLSEIRLARRISALEQQAVLQQQHQQQYPTHVPNHTHNLQNSHSAMVVRQVPYQPSNTVNTFTHTRVSQSLPVQATPVVNAVIKTQPQQTMPIVQPAPQIPVSIETPLTDQTVITSGGLEASPSLQSKPVPKPILPPQIASPPLQAATPVTSPVTKTPPGAGATYTHPETGTVPPVFHYIPAPPSDIANDKSPEAFTKLWIWATYESDLENYIPRVDVYCEYLASSNRYGRQGKSEVLSATDFGKCLKQIFPQATSRLFNQGRGQPQYHIAGIKKRPTPFPVPGHQLKDSVSVFSSDSDHAETRQPKSTNSTSSISRIPVEVTTVVSSKSPISKSQASLPACTAVQCSQVTSVPIQQLQFRQVQTNTIQLPATTMAITSPLTISSTLQGSTAVSVSSSIPTEQPVESVLSVSGTVQNSETEMADASSTINELSKLSNSEPCSDKIKSTENLCKTTNNITDLNSPTEPSAIIRNANPTMNGNDSLTNGTGGSEKRNELCKIKEESSDNASNSESLVNGVTDDNSRDEVLSDSTKLKRRIKSFEEKLTVNGYIDSDNGIELVLSKNFVNGKDSKNTDSSAILNGPHVEETPPSATAQTTSCKYTPPDPNEIPQINIERASLHERIKDTITKKKRKNVLQHTPTTVNAGTSSACTTPVNTTLPPSIIQQYSYRQSQTKRLHEDSKENSCGGLVQQIIPITPQQLQHQYAQQRQQPCNLSGAPQIAIQSAIITTQHQGILNQVSTPVQVTHSSGHKRLFDEATPDTGTVIPQKILRSSVPTYNNLIAGPDLQSVNLKSQSSIYHHTSIRPGQVIRPSMVHTSTHLLPHLNQRPPVPQQQSSGMTVRPNVPSMTHHQHPQVPAIAAQQKAAKPPTIDLMAPNASLLVLYRNVGKIPFACQMDEKEDAISKSVRLTSSLILTNIARYSDYGRSLLQRHESSLASVALSQMDCSPIIARLLSELDI